MSITKASDVSLKNNPTVHTDGTYERMAAEAIHDSLPDNFNKPYKAPTPIEANRYEDRDQDGKLVALKPDPIGFWASLGSNDGPSQASQSQALKNLENGQLIQNSN
jgi:hypothetical protein